MRERLREVSEQLAGRRIDLLGEQSDVVAMRDEPLEEVTSLLLLAASREALGEPERADEEGALVPADAVHAVRHVAAHEPVGLQAPSTRARSSPTRAGIVELDEAHDRDQQVRRVRAPVVIEVLAERVGLRIDAALVDRLPNCLARLLPGIDVAVTVVGLGDSREPVEGDPGQDLGRDEVPELAADLPDSAVRLLPALDHSVADPAQEVPEDVVDLAAVAPVVPGRVQHFSVHVELEL